MRLSLVLFGCAAFQLIRADDNYVTCGSVIKLVNLQEGVRLHSHDVKYGSGSGQQSITGMPEADDANSHWQVLAPVKGHCRRGDSVKCDGKIRLKHLTSGCYLHSHSFNAPLSRGNQEVSCFGKDEESDTGDHWVVSCDTEEWLRGEPVRLKHEDTGKYLATSGQQYGRPISGQREVVGVSSASKSALWKTAEGVYMVRSKEDIYHDVLDRAATKKSCFEDDEEQRVICQEATTPKPKKPSRREHPSQQRPYEEEVEENFMHRALWHFSNAYEYFAELVWWIFKFLFGLLLVYYLYPGHESGFKDYVVMFGVVSVYFWLLQFW